ncbi:putative leucine-rich repeat protein (LRRP) [Trypanosoma rangeli]|uniref:Putative leucine-rich repeat protein (LRRP) n=1 Tax=Trypanosoma rangeli TaxID=5698 RepID=A0A3R7LYV2_TRYRA|nr:putative leucine-rich repeat protein (LRRP) [Trypanosoma rangeli]RNF05991.1 putative leucine-rich repeat protein (LRRP) [Trypanosoma rangeli]|eukprot:RNF05991.1 putative leucine-rich repeat protein (LRRP) [Trypanosoma rangeli]
MFLDVSKAPGEHTALEDIQELQKAILYTERNKIGTLKLQYNNLTTLSISTPLAVALKHVTSLTASYNCLSTLQGLEAFAFLEILDLSHNSLRVLDAHSTSILRRLRYLRRCDFSYNEIRLIDLDIPLHGRENEAPENDDGSDSVTLSDLTVLNLDHNQLIDVPDFRCMPFLEELHLEYNRIECLTDLESRLPLLALTSLSIACNVLRSLQDLLPLTVLAETLKVLVVRGNPCMQTAAVANGCPVRSWLLWILPQLETIDDVPFTLEERQTTAAMFRQHGELSHEAIELMNNHQELQLEAYLQKFALPQVQGGRHTADVMPGTKMEQPAASSKERGASVSSSLGGMTARLPNVLSAPNVGPCASESLARPQSAKTVLPMMQKKLKQLSNVMEVLWKESMTRRMFATVVLQKYARGFLTRQHLPETMRESCARIRSNLRCSLRRQVWNLQPQQTMTTMASTMSKSEAQRFKNSGGDSNEMTVLAKQMRTLESQIRHMWTVMEDLCDMWKRRRNAAAVTIQKYYRGHVDRMKWSRLKRLYDEFVDSLRPEVVIIQRVCRGYLGRRKLMRRRAKTLGIRLLRAEVVQLRRIVEEMRAFMEQSQRRQRLERYVDPEKAIDDIVSTYATSRAAPPRE